MRSLSRWSLVALLTAVAVSALFFSTGRAGNDNVVYLPVIFKEEPINLTVPQVFKTISLPDSLCPNNVGYNQVTDTWYVADHHKIHNGLNYDKHNGRVNVFQNHTLVAHVPVGGRPTAFASDPYSGFTYLTNLPEPYPPGRAPNERRLCGSPSAPGFDPACISVFDGATLLKQHDPHYEPYAAAIHPWTRQFYATDIDSIFYIGYGANEFNQYRLEYPIAGRGSWGLSVAIDPVSGLVYIPIWGLPWLYVINGSTVVGAHQFEGWGARNIALDYRNNLLYIANTETRIPGRPQNNITLVRTADYEDTPVFTAELSFDVKIHHNSGLAYVSNPADGTVSVFRAGQFLRNIEVGNNPRAIDINQHTGYVFVLLQDDNQVAVLRDGALVTKLPTGPMPFALYTDSRSGYTYIANRNSEIRYDGLNRPFEMCMPNPTVTVVK